MSERPRPAKISALISDVDGTLVDDNKALTNATIAAVADLHARGIAFSIISSRPPRGLRMLIEPLKITAPIAGFNGGILATPALAVIEDHILSPEAARAAVDILSGHDVEVWIFGGDGWQVRDPGGLYVDREIRTVQFPPSVVADFEDDLRAAHKIVGVSDDFDLLSRCEDEVRAKLGNAASVVRSQRYYLDITHPLANKGDGVTALSRLMGIPMEEIAVIGDGNNDVAMFERSGLSIAMGNAGPDVQKQAQFVTAPNTDDGFAKAVQNYVLGGGEWQKR